jgi:hypothetical protein
VEIVAADNGNFNAKGISGLVLATKNAKSAFDRVVKDVDFALQKFRVY